MAIKYNAYIERKHIFGDMVANSRTHCAVGRLCGQQSTVASDEIAAVYTAPDEFLSG